MKNIYDKLMAPYEHLMPKIYIEGIQRVCSLKNYAFTALTSILMYQGIVPNCSITYVPQAIIPGSMALAITNESPYKELFNHK